VAHIYYRYFTDTIMGPDGERIVFDPTRAGSQTIHAAVPLVIYVTPKKILGGTYGMMAVMPFASGSLEAPGLGLSEEASTGPSDLYVMPVQLGWRTKRADATAGVAFFAPTGRHAAGASDTPRIEWRWRRSATPSFLTSIACGASARTSPSRSRRRSG
jgi:hypothetical protein